MLNREPFYFNSIKNYIVAMSHVLDDIHVIRKDLEGITVKNITVPLTYSSKTKLYYKLQRDNDINRRLNTILPRISFNFESMTRDSTRSLQYSNITNFDINGENIEYQYTPIPYDFVFSVSIWSKYIDDILQMIEQISSFFDPDFNITVVEIPSLNLTKKIPILLNNIDVQTDNEFDEDDRIVTADLNFTLKGYIYKPISESRIIKYIDVNMWKDGKTMKHLETIELRWNEINESIDTNITSP